MELGLERFEGAFEKLGKLPRPYRIALLPAIVGVVCGIYVYFFYMPAQQELDQIRVQQLELQRNLNEVRSVATNVGAFEQEIEDLETRLVGALRQLPNSKELPVLLTDITSLGKNAGLEFKAFRPQTEKQRDFYAEVPIQIEFSGEYHNIAGFFDQIARLPRIVAIRELRIKIQSESTQTTRLHVTGSATTYRFLEKPVTTPEAAGAGGTRQSATGRRTDGGSA